MHPHDATPIVTATLIAIRQILVRMVMEGWNPPRVPWLGRPTTLQHICRDTLPRDRPGSPYFWSNCEASAASNNRAQWGGLACHSRAVWRSDSRGYLLGSVKNRDVTGSGFLGGRHDVDRRARPVDGKGRRRLHQLRTSRPSTFASHGYATPSATTSTGTASLKLNRDRLGRQSKHARTLIFLPRNRPTGFRWWFLGGPSASQNPSHRAVSLP
jgi:hypothetical protein